jgi:hypothetical protein
MTRDPASGSPSLSRPPSCCSSSLACRSSGPGPRNQSVALPSPLTPAALPANMGREGDAAVNTNTTNEHPEPLADNALGPVGDFSPPRIPKGNRSLTRIYAGVFLLSFIVLVYALTPGGWGAAPAFFVFGFSASYVLLRHGYLWRPARPNPFRRRAMTGPVAVGVAAVAALAIAAPGAAIIGLIWAGIAALATLKNRFGFGLDSTFWQLVVALGPVLILGGVVAATCASYLVARRLFPPTPDA